MSERKLYGIWYANYSNSSAGDAVYTARDDAYAAARATGGDVIEFDLDPPLDDKAQRLRRPGERQYHVAMDANGDEAQAWEIAEEDEPAPRIYVREDGKRITSGVWAIDERHAIKIVNERRGFWIAAGMPMPDRFERSSPYSTGWGAVPGLLDDMAAPVE